jgi:hypothetical protein
MRFSSPLFFSPMKGHFKRLDDVPDSDFHHPDAADPVPAPAQYNAPEEPSAADVHFRRGRNLLAEGEYYLAEAELMEAIRLGTSFPNQAQFLLRSAMAAQAPREGLYDPHGPLHRN